MNEAAKPTARITIVGLGPGDAGDLTLRAVQALSAAPLVILRTARHPVVDALAEILPAMPRLDTCDNLYEAHKDFAAVYRAITDKVLAAALEDSSVVYAVPGHPWVGEQTTRMILDAAHAQNVQVEIVGGLSFVEPSFAAAEVDLMDGAQVVDAMLLARQHAPHVEVGLPLLVAQVYARWLASDLKLTLLNTYPAEHEVLILRAAGGAQQEVTPTPLHALDAASHQFDHLTSVYVPPQAAGRSLTDLVEIVAHLRAPEGCPWDREQTLESLRTDLLSECAEVLEAIDAEADGDDNSAHIAEELGDLLMVALMLIQIAAEEGRFLLGDVTEGIVTKLIRRHPHVFGATLVDNAAEVVVNWDAIKQQEKAAKGVTASPLDGVPAALPALEKARQLQHKARKAGLLDRGALAHRNPALAALFDARNDDQPFAEALWQLVALAAERDVNLEDALRTYAINWRTQQKDD